MWPFSSSIHFVPEKNISDLSGKVILVTGGNTGIGKETVLQLAKHSPAKIYLAARTASKAAEAISSIQRALPTTNKTIITHLPLDLTTPSSILSASRTILSDNNRLDILVLNAGIMATPPSLTTTGHDTQLFTNHLGHFLLTKRLLPLLVKTASSKDLPNSSDVRVITVSSEAWNMAPASLNEITSPTLAKQGDWTRYGASKACNLLFARQLAVLHPEITSLAVHPGLIKTDLYSSTLKTNWILRYALGFMQPFMFSTVAQGAYNQLWASAGVGREEVRSKKLNGKYFVPVGHEKHSGNPFRGWVFRGDVAERLWVWSEKECETIIRSEEGLKN